MTAPQLLAYICLALLLQVAAGVGVGVWRRRALMSARPPVAKPEDSAASTGAWPGWRDFRVLRRTFEDVSKTQCSFQLQPVDGMPLPDFKPGQYLTFSLQVRDGAGVERSVARCYSLSERPDPASYRITIKRMPPPASRPDSTTPPG